MNLSEQLFRANAPLPRWLKQGLAITGLLWALPGLPLLFGYLCITVILTINGDPEALRIGLVSFTLMMLTLGVGSIIFWHSLRSAQGHLSNPLHFPSIGLTIGLFIFSIVIGLFFSENGFATGFFFPPLLLGAATLPPLFAMSWFTQGQKGGLTWRRGLLAFAGGATVSVFLALLLEIVFPTIILALVAGLAESVFASVQDLLDTLMGTQSVSAITSQGFIYLFIQLAIIAPIVEEIVKPLIVLPLLGRLSRREAFLVGAMAGAGFAAVENVIYAGFGFFSWAGILMVRALGGAIHPLGAGLVASGWWGVLKGKPGAWSQWFVRFGLAIGIHAFWNGGSLLVITLTQTGFFGPFSTTLNILGLSTAATTLALLVVLGIVALWLGRSLAQKDKIFSLEEGESTNSDFIISDRAAAIWALGCLVAIVPIGISGLQILTR